MNRSGLLFRLAVVMVFASTIVVFISAQLFYRLTYLNEVEFANKEISQLYHTVSATASIAAYLNDTELAKEVANGLATNGVVHGVKITTENSVISSTVVSDNEPLVFTLNSPFEKNREVGKLAIIPDLKHIENRAKDIGEANAKALIAQASVVTIVAIFIAYILITRPMINIAANLHDTMPGTPHRLPVPDFHENSELGKLVRDINELLKQTESQISEERVLRKEMEILEKRFRMLFENSASPIVLMEPRGSILLHNDAFTQMLNKVGVRFKTNLGPLLSELLDTPEQLIKSVKSAFENDEIATGEYKLINQTSSGDKKQNSLWTQIVVTSIVSDDLKEYYQLTLHDISRRKKELEQLSLKINYDHLTQLQSRHAVEKMMLEYISSHKSFAYILIDLNGFKQVNDVYGHDAGNEILIYISSQLKKSIRHDDIVCRWGGDEFALMLADTSIQGVKVTLEKILAKINKNYYLSKYDKNIAIGASMGVSFYPRDAKDMQTLIGMADDAMYAVKRKSDSNGAGENEKSGLMFATEPVK